MQEAIILCEGKLGEPTGKTARGLVRYSRKYRIAGVIDSTRAGSDAGEVVDGMRRDIPVFASLEEAIGSLESIPEVLIVGVATIGGRLPLEFREPIKNALRGGMDVVAGLHEFLSEDPEFSAIASNNGSAILDIRREPPLEKMHGFRNLASMIDAVRIPILGTDSACGKRTTAIELTESLNNTGVKTVFVATGQTGLLQGVKYGVPLDSIQGDYMVGELENAIYQAYIDEEPDVIVIEGQGSFTHPAYVCGTRAIISASKPSAIILQHAPGRNYRNYNSSLKIPLPHLEEEISLLESFTKVQVIALGISHEGLKSDEIEGVRSSLEQQFGIPTVDIYLEGADRLAKAVISHFPHLDR
ncbi:MAG TPA: DUF1611 domain-containing protein [Methanomassiliicoccales archaeon]|nr:DUF1611 domain-containing protein [Methanomassiliicoccales archaeon]